MLLIATASISLGGKLADDNGFRGTRFGEAMPTLVQRPLPDCMLAPHFPVMWRCFTTIGRSDVEVNYLVENALYYGVLVVGSTKPSCENLLKILAEAWGIPDQPDRAVRRWFWLDGDVGATFAYEAEQQTCTLMITNNKVYERTQAIERDKIKAAAGKDL